MIAPFPPWTDDYTDLLAKGAARADKGKAMGIHDRDYYRKGAHGGSSFLLWTRSPFGVLISINIVVWLTQVIGGDVVTNFLCARPRDVFGSLEIWRLVTANFA